MPKRNNLDKQVGTIEMKVYLLINWGKQKIFMNFNTLMFPWKAVDVHPDTISLNVYIGDCNSRAKFHACITKCTICLKFRAMPTDYKKKQKHFVFKACNMMFISG